MSRADTRPEALTRDECLRHLAFASVGRVVMSARALPAVNPVRFVLLGDRVVFRAEPADQPGAISDNAVVGFQADDIDPLTHEGWTVVIVGHATHVREPSTLAALESVAPAGWNVGDGPLISLSLDLVNGRRLSSRQIGGATP